MPGVSGVTGPPVPGVAVVEPPGVVGEVPTGVIVPGLVVTVPPETVVTVPGPDGRPAPPPSGMDVDVVEVGTESERLRGVDGWCLTIDVTICSARAGVLPPNDRRTVTLREVPCCT